MKKAKNTKKTRKKQGIPESFKPILWGLDWDRLDATADREDIVVNAINEGTLDQWRWIRATYGDAKIRSIIKHRLSSEFHPESMNLARIVFGIKPLTHARRSLYTKRA
jgi:hypothetical protein